MKDQYGNTIPDDLVVPTYQPWLTDEEVKAIMDADWYEEEISGLILVPFSQLPTGISESAYMAPEDCLDDPIEEMGGDIFYIADCLKRFSPEDDFYHA